MKELMHHVLKKKIAPKQNILYLNLEHPYFNQFKDDVAYLLRVYDEFKRGIQPKEKIFVFLDEVQFFKDWQVFVKHLYEKKEAKIIVTGSNSKLLSSELATLLSGRSIAVHLYPYSFREFVLATKKGDVLAYLEKGGFPEVAKLSRIEQIKLIIENYYKNILYQDVIPRFGIKNALAVENLSYYLLSNAAKLISYHTLAQIAKLDDKTIKQYLSHLEDANLLYLAANYDPSLKKQIGNKKKVYAVDFSFINFLGFSSSRNLGRLLENAVYLELRRKGGDIYFYSTLSTECDFIVKSGHRIVQCIQVCASLREDATRNREISALLATLTYFKLDEGTIITENEHETVTVEGKRIVVIPFAAWIAES